MTWNLQRLVRSLALTLVAALGTARLAAAQAGQAGQPAPQAPIVPPQANPPPPAARRALPVQWWCEVNAQPAPGAQLSVDEASQNFFVSQIIGRPPRAGPDEKRAVERICRTAFEVQLGGRWELLTARAQQAPTPEAAQAGRRADLRTGNHLGHVQNFRIPD